MRKYHTKLPEPPGPLPKAWEPRKLPEAMRATDAQKIQLKQAAMKLRKIAAPVGCMHAAWDLIFDLEALVVDRETFLGESVKWYLNEAARWRQS